MLQCCQYVQYFDFLVCFFITLFFDLAGGGHDVAHC